MPIEKVSSEALLTLVRKTALLAPIPEPELLAALESCVQRVLQPGEALCREGEEGHAMFVVLSGHLVVSRDGKQVAVGSPGDCFGEMALIESRERAATLKALDETVVLEIPDVVFWEHIAPRPDSLMALLRIFSDRSRHDLESLAAENIKLEATRRQLEEKNSELEAAQRELENNNRLLERLSALDTLTGIANRRRFDDVLRQEWKRAARHGNCLSLLFCDIDHFKQFNDTYGHQLGDEVLRLAAQAMSSVSRSDELFARYGGEEFALVAIDCSPTDLFVTGERLRKAVEELRVPSESGPLAVTVSAGAAVLDQLFDRDAGVRLIKLADEALYGAKEAGRNQVQVAQ